MKKRAHERYVVRELENVYPKAGANGYKVMNLSRSGCAVQSHEALENQE